MPTYGTCFGLWHIRNRSVIQNDSRSDLYLLSRVGSRISHYNASFSVVIDESNAITTVIYRQLFLASLRELCIILLSKWCITTLLFGLSPSRRWSLGCYASLRPPSLQSAAWRTGTTSQFIIIISRNKNNNNLNNFGLPGSDMNSGRLTLFSNSGGILWVVIQVINY